MAEALTTNTTLTWLDLGGVLACQCMHVDIMASCDISIAYEHMHSVVTDNRIGCDGVAALADALRRRPKIMTMLAVDGVGSSTHASVCH